MSQNKGAPPAADGVRGSGATVQAAKAAVQQRLRRLKSRIALATLLGFGALSGLAAGHRVGAATHAAPPAAATPAPAASSRSSGGFFDQGGSGGQGGYGFGSGDSGQPPVAGSGAS